MQATRKLEARTFARQIEYNAIERRLALIENDFCSLMYLASRKLASFFHGDVQPSDWLFVPPSISRSFHESLKTS